MTSRLVIALYLDEDVHKRLANALRLRGFDAISAQESGSKGATDGKHLEFASLQQRAVVTFNVRDFVRLHTEFMQAGRDHWGIIVSQQFPIGEMLRRLLHILNTVTAQEMRNQLRFLRPTPP